MYVGTDHLQAANHRNIMLNIASVDADRILLNNKVFASGQAIRAASNAVLRPTVHGSETSRTQKRSLCGFAASSGVLNPQGNKSQKARFYTQTIDMQNPSSYTKLGPLFIDNKNVFSIREDNPPVISLKLTQECNLDDSKPVVCVIPVAGGADSSFVITVNGQRKKISSSTENEKIKYNSLSFKLPAETKEIEIKAEGKIGTVFAIKDIQIWQ